MSETYLKRDLEPTSLRERRLTVAQQRMVDALKEGNWPQATSLRTIRSLRKRGYIEYQWRAKTFVLTEKGRKA